MAHNHKISLSIIIIFISWTHLFLSATGSADPVPTPWPPQFHSILYMNTTSGKLQITDLWYDYPNGRNFNIIQKQLGKKLYDLEWDNGTSYYYTLDANKECTVRHFSVGILRPNWLSGAQYLGRVVKDGFLCDAWTKVDFIWYYEDVVTKRPVSWTFYTGMVAHVMTFEVGKVLDDPGWQAPVYCFDGANKDEESMLESSTEFPVEGPFMRDVTSTFAI